MRPEITQAMELLSSNDPTRIDEAIALLQSTVYSFSMKVCGHHEDAEDTMQEVLFKSIPYLAKIDDPRATAVWLYTVTQNQYRMARRRSKFAPAHTITLDSLMPDAAEISLLLSDSGPSPETSAISQEGDRLLHNAVLRIPPMYRLILVLHDMEELETEEIARITSLKAGTVRVRLHRARLLVRKELAQNRFPQAPPTSDVQDNLFQDIFRPSLDVLAGACRIPQQPKLRLQQAVAIGLEKIPRRNFPPPT